MVRSLALKKRRLHVLAGNARRFCILADLAVRLPA